MAHQAMKYEDIKNEMELEVWANEELKTQFANCVPFYMEIKPGFQKYEKEIIERLENAGLKVVARNLINRTREFNKVFYQNLLDRPDIWKICNTYMTGKMYHPYVKSEGLLPVPTIGLMVVGDMRNNPIAIARKLQGKTGSPDKGTIRYDFALRDEHGNIKPNITANVIHCSDSIINGIKEAYLSFYGCEKYGMTPHIEHRDAFESILADMCVNDMYTKIMAKEKEFAEKNAPVVVEKKTSKSRNTNGGDRKAPKKSRGQVAKQVIDKSNKNKEESTK